MREVIRDVKGLKCVLVKYSLVQFSVLIDSMDSMGLCGGVQSQWEVIL